MKFVIIVAGGKGLRMGSDLPKQFLPIGERPLLMHTLEAFERACPGIRQILVLPQEQQDFWQTLCLRHTFTLPHTIVAGGPTRFHSVQNGLAAIPPSSPISPNGPNSPISPLPPTGGVGEGSLVAVHDGVRPFASEAVIRRCFDAARQHGAAVPVTPVVETLRELSPSGSVSDGLPAGASFTVDRSRYRLVQTPQTFQLPLLRRAYEQPYRETFTDDASVVEALGHPITLVEGNRENIKITTPFDLTIAEALLASAHS
ncbi:MAG: 2-C-methyl-D-erythritol 4-phosphate cytidylyltransferase [Bacteroidaceae bacterium]|nr:2-C-methyl-D-erythritol 4-phosphate cytidylyltransferase [Bacteroidaceae bacterium]